MNILKHEIKSGLKPFLLWTLGLFVLVFAGVTKSTGFSSGSSEGVAAIIDVFPRVVQAVFGMIGTDISTFGGFYAVLAQYSAILTAVYAVQLGNGAVSRESTYKTYEFLFTKPRSRSFILAHKLLAGAIYLTAFCLLNFLFTFFAAASLELAEDMTAYFAVFALSAWLIGMVFLALGTAASTAFDSPERGAKAGNYSIIVAFVTGVVFDMFERAAVLRFIAPFKYFLPAEMLDKNINPIFAVLCALIFAIFMMASFRSFEKRDLKEG